MNPSTNVFFGTASFPNSNVLLRPGQPIRLYRSKDAIQIYEAHLQNRKDNPVGRKMTTDEIQTFLSLKHKCGPLEARVLTVCRPEQQTTDDDDDDDDTSVFVFRCVVFPEFVAPDWIKVRTGQKPVSQWVGAPVYVSLPPHIGEVVLKGRNETQQQSNNIQRSLLANVVRDYHPCVIGVVAGSGLLRHLPMLEASVGCRYHDILSPYTFVNGVRSEMSTQIAFELRVEPTVLDVLRHNVKMVLVGRDCTPREVDFFRTVVRTLYDDYQRCVNLFFVTDILSRSIREANVRKAREFVPWKEVQTATAITVSAPSSGHCSKKSFCV
eukprot:PhM_4_TR14076/c1_g1_i1/m.60817